MTHPEQSGVVYAGTLESGVFLSEDGGESWRKLDAFGTVADIVNVIAVPPSNPLKIYAGTEGFGVQASDDGGQYFNTMINGLGNLDILSLAVDDQSSDLLFAGTRGGLFKTESGGRLWRPTDVTDGSVTDISIDDGTRPRRVRITTFGNGFARSLDEGETFQVSNRGLASLELTSIESEPRGEGERLWVGMRGEDGVAYSDDGGETWRSAAGEGLLNRNVNDLLVTPAGRLWAATDGGVFWSGDGGRSLEGSKRRPTRWSGDFSRVRPHEWRAPGEPRLGGQRRCLPRRPEWALAALQRRPGRTQGPETGPRRERRHPAALCRHGRGRLVCERSRGAR